MPLSSRRRRSRTLRALGSARAVSEKETIRSDRGYVSLERRRQRPPRLVGDEGEATRPAGALAASPPEVRAEGRDRGHEREQVVRTLAARDREEDEHGSEPRERERGRALAAARPGDPERGGQVEAPGKGDQREIFEVI